MAQMMTIGSGDSGAGGPASVFLSYSREDRPRAEAVLRVLEAEGFDVWWDGLLEGGAAFAQTTENALENADAVVVLWSARAVRSHWVRDEATRGRDRGCMVPVSIDGSEPPLGFRQIQYIDLSKWNGKAKCADLKALTRAIRGAAATPGEQLARPSVQLPVPYTTRRRLLIGTATSIAIAGGAVAWLGRGTPPDNSVAVLPFKNMSGDPTQAYFSDGLAEEIRNTLSKNINLRILAPTSVAAVSAIAGNAVAAAKKLGVLFLLEGSVRRSGDIIRISAELVDGKTGFSLWSDRFDRTLTDIFAVQSDIARSVAAALSAQTVATSANEQVRGRGLSESGTRSVVAFDAYLRGRAFYELRTGESAYRAALGQFDAAIAADKNYAQAHAARARVVTVLTSAYARADNLRALYDDAIQSARLAVALAPSLAITQSTLGYCLVQGRMDFRSARAPYVRSNQLGYGDATVQLLYAVFCAQIGNDHAAVNAVNRAISLDPLNAAPFRAQALIHYLGRRFGEAVAACQQALTLNPKLDSVHGFMGDALFHQGRLKEARIAYLKEPDESPRLAGLAIIERRLGAEDKAKAAQDQLTSAFGDSASYQQAQILAQAGDIRGALARLRRARAIGDSGLGQLRGDPFFDPLRRYPELSDLEQELGLR
jgi:TolB-like protein